MKLDKDLAAMAAVASKKAVYIIREWKVTNVLTLTDYANFCKKSGTPDDLRYADKKAVAEYRISIGLYKGQETEFHNLRIPLTTGAIAEVRASRRIREGYIEGATFAVKDLRAILCAKVEHTADGKEKVVDATWVFDDVTEIEE